MVNISKKLVRPQNVHSLSQIKFLTVCFELIYQAQYSRSVQHKGKIKQPRYPHHV